MRPVLGLSGWKMAMKKPLRFGAGSAPVSLAEFNRIYKILGVDFGFLQWRSLL